MRVLGIDPGSRYLGFGVVERAGGKVLHVGHGVLRLDGKAPLARRLEQIFVELKLVLEGFAPDVVAVEGVFTHKNARSALILGHARGVALLLAAQAGKDVFEYAPARVKKAVGAGGNDSKDSVARMVKLQLGLTEPIERVDASDALAVALCHLHRAGGVRPRAVAAQAKARGGAPLDFCARLKPSVVPARSAS
ncbi:MAG: crossover junction endodeoxyribonuclease RuvC [Myxococcales bacterium]|nr:crossover junction endodeoxyribonuclease RuvC [Myxococcales bacterium]